MFTFFHTIELHMNFSIIFSSRHSTVVSGQFASSSLICVTVAASLRVSDNIEICVHCLKNDSMYDTELKVNKKKNLENCERRKETKNEKFQKGMKFQRAKIVMN